MKVAIIYNKDRSKVINLYGIQNKEIYNTETVKNVANALETGGHNVSIIDGNMHVIEALQEFMPRVVEGEKMGMVFNMAYGIQGESRYTHLPAMLEMLGIPYIGSAPTGHAIALDKVITKIIMQKYDISTPNFWVFSSYNDDMSKVEFPVIVKPKMEAVSFGLHIVNKADDLYNVVKHIIDKFQQDALVEQFITGREFCVGLLGNNPCEAFPVLEIDLENDPFAIQTLNHKKNNPRKKICPADLSKEVADEMVKLSIRAFQVLHLRDFARVDIRMDEDYNIYLLEVNSMASLGSTGSYIYAANVAGYDFNALINKMLDVAAVRYFAEKTILKEDPDEKNFSTKKKFSHPVRIRAFLRSREENLENILSSIVNINSYFRNVQGVNDLGNFIARQLISIGFKKQVISQIELGNILLFQNYEDNQYDVLLLDHLDNSIKSSEYNHYRAQEQRLYGTGIWENKGGLVVMIAALQALRFVRLLRKLRVAILLTTDDSLHGRYSQEIIKKISQKAQCIISLRGSGLEGTVVTSRSGAALYNCHMNLKKRVESEEVSRSIGLFSKIVTEWTQLTDKSIGLIVSPSEINMKSNISDGFAHGEVSLSIRFNHPDQINNLTMKIRKLAKINQKNLINIQIDGGVRRPSMIENQYVDKLWNLLKKNAEKLDIRLMKEHRWSSADICFVDDNKFRIDGLGPIGANPRGKEEFILKHSLFERATLLAIVVSQLSSINE